MVHCRQAAFTVVFKHREVDNPQRCPFAFVGQTKVFTHFQAQCAHRVGNNFLVVGTEENHIAILRGSTIQDGFDDFCIKELRYRAVDTFQTFRAFVNFDVSQTFRAVDFNEVTVFVDLLTGQRCAARNAQSRYATFRIVRRTCKYSKLNRFQQISNVSQFHRVTQIRFIRTITAFCFRKGHYREIAQIHTLHFQPQMTHQRFHHFTHLRRGHERSFHIDLSKFRLTISAQVFVTEAFNDLIVTVKTGHHQQLFEQLRGLRQCVEFTFVHTRRHQVVTRAFRRGFGQHRSFDVEEAVVIHKTAHQAGDFSAGFQALSHFRTTQVEVAVFQTRFFGVDVVRVKRQNICAVDDSQRGRQHFDFAGRHIAVNIFFVTRTYGARDLNAELITQFRGQL